MSSRLSLSNLLNRRAKAPASPPPTGFKAQTLARAEAVRNGPAYVNYLKVREFIFTMMDDWTRIDPEGGPSAYWQEEIEGFLYLFDASPLVIAQLREQCYHITGIKSYEYRNHHSHRVKHFIPKYKMLKTLDTAKLFVPEPPELGGFGLDVGPGKVNIDTLKFYEVLIGMERGGVLPAFRGKQAERKLVMEIGSGWGGFAYQFKKKCPNTTYVLVDLPPTMIFSGVYLTTLFPNAKTLFYGEDGFDEKIKNIKDYDFVFVPQYYFAKLRGLPIDMAINMVSFQEMTTAQVDGYVRQLSEWGCPLLYSLNRDRSKNNNELTTVTEIAEQYYDIDVIKLLDLQYYQLVAPPTWPAPSIFDYRHFVARPKKGA